MSDENDLEYLNNRNLCYIHKDFLKKLGFLTYGDVNRELSGLSKSGHSKMMIKLSKAGIVGWFSGYLKVTRYGKRLMSELGEKQK